MGQFGDGRFDDKLVVKHDIVAIGNPERHVHKASAPWQQATTEIMLAISYYIACSRYIYDGVILHAHPVRGESQSTQHHRRGCNNIPSFLQRTTPIARSL